MHFKKMQQTLLKDGFIFALAEVKRIFRAIDELEPWVEEFHRALRRAVMRRGGVATSWGWQLDLRSEMASWIPARMKAEAYKRAYMFIEQSEVGVMTKQYGLLTYRREVRPHFRARMNMLVHDNVVLSVPANELYSVMAIMYKGLVRERPYGIYHPSFCECGACDKVETIRVAIPAEMKISRTLSCTCDECKKDPRMKALEFGTLPNEPTFKEAFLKWQN